MIVLINGPFGIGKTTTAPELAGLLPNAIHFAPELIGGFLRRLLGPLASRGELTRRILGRPDAEGSHDWCLSHLDQGLTDARDPAFGIEIDTEGRTPRQVAPRIARHLPVLTRT